mmetsp:Transcript_104573/g.312332  ORF Transcript_104573/g.312332 Transcript_104573/m.312332 type:complete len:277 (+) Transcript_104573:1443-2273(+)
MQCPGCLARVKHVHYVGGEVLLQPLDVVVRPVQDLDDTGVAEDLVELLHLLKDVKRVDDVVLLPCGYLHEAHEASVRPEVVVLHVHRDLPSLAGGLDLPDHLPQVALVAHDDQGGVLHPGVRLWLPRLEEAAGPGERAQLLVVGVRQRRAPLGRVHPEVAEVPLQHAELLGLPPAALGRRPLPCRCGGARLPGAHARPALGIDEPRVERRPLVVLDQDPGHELRAVVVNQLPPSDLRLLPHIPGGGAQVSAAACSARGGGGGCCGRLRRGAPRTRN